MAVPKSKTSKSKRNLRRSHHALTNVQTTVDKNGNAGLPHHISSGGLFKGRQVFVKPELKSADTSSDKK